MADDNYEPHKRQYTETTYNGWYYGLKSTKGFIDDFGNFIVSEDD